MMSFKNPISPFDSPDPFVTYDAKTGYYYALFTRGYCLEIFRSRHAAHIIIDGDSKVIYTPDGEKHGIWGDIWAPEMHRGSDGGWYIYTSGRILPQDSEKRLFIVRALSDDPFGEWEFAGKPSPDVFSIDPTSYIAKDGTQYVCCSRVAPGVGQVLDIVRMETPTTFSEECATVAKAELAWELVPPYDGHRSIVEGGFFVEHQDRLFLVYSANGCWSDEYALGVLEHTGGAICDAANWKKHGQPLLVKGAGAYGPGHASFFRSPDGQELWCAFHAMKEHNEHVVPAARYLHIQRVDFDESGYLVMGEAKGPFAVQQAPSGECR